MHACGEDTNAVDSGDLKVVYQLDHHVLVGIVGVALSHLEEEMIKKDLVKVAEGRKRNKTVIKWSGWWEKDWKSKRELGKER